jgi:hypothetical protein
MTSRSLSRKSRFAIQIAASAESGDIARQVLRTTDELHRQELLVEWEHMETLANVMSPESTVAPSTFVDVVLGGQLKMRRQTVLGPRELYLVLLENLGFMEMHLKPSDGKIQLRKSYKYATRACGAYTRMNCVRSRASSREEVGWEHMTKWKLFPLTDIPWLRRMLPLMSVVPETEAIETQIRTSLEKLLGSLRLFARRYLDQI